MGGLMGPGIDTSGGVAFRPVGGATARPKLKRWAASRAALSSRTAMRLLCEGLIGDWRHHLGKMAVHADRRHPTSFLVWRIAVARIAPAIRNPKCGGDAAALRGGPFRLVPLGIAAHPEYPVRGKDAPVESMETGRFAWGYLAGRQRSCQTASPSRGRSPVS